MESGAFCGIGLGLRPGGRFGAFGKLAVLLAALPLVTQAGEVEVEVSDPNGTAGRAAAPVALQADLPPLFGTRIKPGGFQATEVDRAGRKIGNRIPVQFEPETNKSLRGTLWWLMPPGEANERRFRLSPAADEPPAALTVQTDKTARFYDIAEHAQPVLRYNHGTVPAPRGIATNFARGDYIMPLFGPGGKMLTDDYPKDHPHHRGVSWSWPVTRWGAEVRDIWAVSGVWARPVAMRRVETGSVFALLEAENVWKWGDLNPIVREEVLIRAFRRSGENRLVDIEVRLTALADGVAIGGRPHAGYGGFGLRAMPARQRVITRHSDPLQAQPRRAWLDYSGVFAGDNTPSGLAIFEHVANLHYPSALLEYPELNYVMPAFPGEREVPLSKDRPLVLKHRLWIHAGMGNDKRLADIWSAYAAPPKAAIRN